FQKALKLDPDSKEALFLLGSAQYKAGFMVEARTNLNAYCKAIPDNSWAWLHLATISQQENKHLQAIEEFKKANACPDADSAAVYYSRAISYLELKMIQEANSDVDSALSFHSTDPTVLLSLGYELNQLERYEEALQVLEQAIALDSTFAYAYNNRGFAKYKLGQYEAAILDFNKSIALKNDYYHWPPYNRANALRALGRDKEAIDDFNLSLSYKADYAVALNDRGETWEKLGNMDKAVSDYQEALKADPDLETAKKNLQRLGK
ncbi:MAG TPA: tetratricopeptide repeat protein, partial [Bacteroidia bacterium]|nr:tetratricopeptide repeat protein [Bacteroidia bacterium]